MPFGKRSRWEALEKLQGMGGGLRRISEMEGVDTRQDREESV